MRISCKSGDPGYDPMAVGHYRILLDGIDITKCCYIADEELGKVWCYSLSAKGEVKRLEGKLVTEMLFGNVKVEMI